MDEAARQVLKKHKSEIKKNLNLDDDILDTLEADDTLSIDQVQKVKAEKTNSEKISSLLFILQKKGPDAFTAFINAISPAYKFLADKLIERYNEELKKIDRDSGNSSEESLEQGDIARNESSSSVKEPVSPTTNVKTSLPHVGQQICPPLQRNTDSEVPRNFGNDSTRNIVKDVQKDEGHDVVRNTGNDLHRHINHVLPHGCPPQEQHSPRHHSNHISDFGVHPTNHFLNLHHASRRSSHSIDFATHQNLNGMYTKLKMHLFHMNEREQSFSSPEPVTFEMVEELLDKLLKLEQDCSKAIGASNKDSLLTNIINLKLLKAKLQQSLNKKEEQVQKYASKILKLETMSKDKEFTINQQMKTIETLRNENERLKEENEKLKDDLCQSELSKQVESEKHFKDRSLKSLSKQNEEIRKQNVWYAKELDIMHQKLSVLSHQAHNQSSAMSKDITDSVFDNERKKDTVTINKVSEVNGNSKSTSSILQECKDLCSGGSSRNNLQYMKNKILFAEAKRPESKAPKDSFYHDKTEKAEPEQNNDTPNDQRRTQNGSESYYQKLSKLSTNKSIPLQTNLIKQKSPIQMKKPMVNKGLKKHPRWIRKPLR